MWSDRVGSFGRASPRLPLHLRDRPSCPFDSSPVLAAFASSHPGETSVSTYFTLLSLQAPHDEYWVLFEPSLRAGPFAPAAAVVVVVEGGSRFFLVTGALVGPAACLGFALCDGAG